MSTARQRSGELTTSTTDDKRPEEKTSVEPITEALRLLKRQSELQSGLRRFGGMRVTEERELFLIRNKLAQYPAAVQAITITAAELHRPVDTLSVRDVEKRC
jgi:hypothetical protein